MTGLRSDLMPNLQNYPNERSRKLEFLVQAGTSLTVLSSFFDMNYGCPRLARDDTMLSKFYKNVDYDANLFDYAPASITRDMHFVRFFKLEEMGCRASLEQADLYARFFSSFRFLLEIFGFVDSDELFSKLSDLKNRFPKLSRSIEILSNGIIRRNYEDLGCTTHDKKFHAVISVRPEKSHLCLHRTLPAQLFDLYQKMHEELMRQVRRSQLFSRRKDHSKTTSNQLFHPVIYEKIAPPPVYFESLTKYLDCLCVKIRHLVVDNHSFQFDVNISIDLLMISSRFLTNYEMREMTSNDLARYGATFSQPLQFSDINSEDREKRRHYHANPEELPHLLSLNQVKDMMGRNFCESHNIETKEGLTAFLQSQKEKSEKLKKRMEVLESDMSVVELPDETLVEDEENVWDKLTAENTLFEREWRSQGLENNSVMIDVFGLVHFYCAGQFFKLKTECLKLLFVDGQSLEGSEEEVLPLFFDDVEISIPFHREKIGIYSIPEILVCLEFLQKMKTFSTFELDTLVQSICQIFKPTLNTNHEGGLYRFFKPDFCSFFPGFEKFNKKLKVIGQILLNEGKVEVAGTVFKGDDDIKKEEEEEDHFGSDRIRIIPHSRILEIIWR